MEIRDVIWIGGDELRDARVRCGQCGVAVCVPAQKLGRVLSVIGNSVLLGVLLTLVIACGGGVPEKRKTTFRKADAKLQAERKRAIQQAIGLGLIQKIDTPGSDPRLYVLPKFSRLTFDEKRAVAELCFAWAYELPKQLPKGFDKFLWLYDAMTNKKIGFVSGSVGLQLD